MAEKRATRIFAGGGHSVTGSGAKYQGGLFRTTADDGEWRPVTQGLPENVEARAFLVHPDDSDVIYAGTQDGPYRSTDRGVTWERLGFPQRDAKQHARAGRFVRKVGLSPPPRAVAAGSDRRLYFTFFQLQLAPGHESARVERCALKLLRDGLG